MIEAYQYALRNVQLYGPTNAAPIIKHVARFAYDAAKKQDTQVSFSIYTNCVFERTILKLYMADIFLYMSRTIILIIFNVQ